jgi:hypothetical protein
MRGEDTQNQTLFSYVRADDRIPSNHPLRLIRETQRLLSRPSKDPLWDASVPDLPGEISPSFQPHDFTVPVLHYQNHPVALPRESACLTQTIIRSNRLAKAAPVVARPRQDIRAPATQ